MKQFYLKIFSVFILGIFILFPLFSLATDYYAVVSGNWNAAATWSNVSCAGGGGDGFPTGSDNAYICSGVTVAINVNSSCNNLNLQGGTINFSNNNRTLTVNNDMTVNNVNTITGNNASRILNVTGNLIISSGASLDISGQTVNITGNVQIDGTLSISSATGTKTFNGLVTTGANGTWNNSANEDITYHGGIINNGTFSSGTGIQTFSTNSQNISGANAMTFDGNVTITGEITVNNQNTAGVLIAGELNGSVAGSEWNNNINSILDYQNATQPMATGILTASANPNYVYYSLGGAQTIKGTTYYNLIVSGGAGTKTLGASTIVNGDFTLTSATSFNPAGFNLTVSGLSTINGIFADAAAAGTTTLNNVDLSDGTINGTATGVININGNLTMPSGNGTIGRVQLTVNGTTDVAAGRILTLNSNTGIKTFAGQVTVNGTWISTIITTAANLVFRNGITNNGSSFSAGSCTYNTNDQSLEGSTAFGFKNSIVVTGVNLTNNSVATLSNTAAGTLSGTGTWLQGTNSILKYSGSTITITALDASSPGNTIDYSGNLAQTVFNTVSGKYYHLDISNTNTKTLSSSIDVDGDLSISGTSVFSVSTFGISVAGNWNNSSTNADPFTQGTRTVTFDGVSAQSIFNTGSTNGTVFNNVIINNTSVSGVTLAAPVTVNSAFTLSNGLLNTDATNLLSLIDNATATSGTSTSYVNGPMKKTGNDAFVFPVGKGGYWARIGISAPATATTEFTAEYFDNPYTDLTPVISPLLDVSVVEYWTLNRAVNPDNVNVTLYWEDNVRSQIYTSMTGQLVVARWTGSDWVSEGQSAVSSGPSGNITSNSVSTFGTFTFGDVGGALPVELLSFTSEVNEDAVELRWETATETNNDFFTVEKSADAVNFITVAIVSGAGNSNEPMQYTAYDYEPYDGISYYRLKQTDFNGQFTYSDVVSVNISHQNNTSITWWQEGSILNLNIISSYEGSAVIEIYDYSGRLIQKHNFSTENRSTITTFNTDVLKKGFYILRILLGNEQKTIKVYYH